MCNKEMTFVDYARIEIERQANEYFEYLKESVIELIRQDLEEEEIKDGVPELCKNLILLTFSNDENLL